MDPNEAGEIREDERFDEEKLADYLRLQVPELQGAMNVEQFHGGSANLTYALDFENAQCVLRRPPLGPVAPRSHDMRREFHGLDALAPLYPHSPRPIHLCEDEEVIGAVFFLMERRNGIVIRNEWPDELPDDPALRRRISESMIDALADLHCVDTTRPEVAALGKPEGFLERQITGWAGRWERAKTRELEIMDGLRDCLVAHMPPSDYVAVLHNDYKLDNTIYDTVDPGRLVGVFDWDMVTLGDPLVDLGTLLGYWSQESDTGPRGATGTPVSKCPGFLTREELTERYQARTGFDLSRLGFYEIFALFKTAVVVEQIYVRWVKGQTKDSRFEALGALTPVLAAAAQELTALYSPGAD